MPDLEAEIPHEVQDELDRPEDEWRRGVLGQEQQVDIAERGQQPAPVAAGGGDAHLLRRRPGRIVMGEAGCGVVVEGSHQAVGEGRKLRRRLDAGQGLVLEVVAHGLLDPRQVAAEQAHGLVAGHRAGGVRRTRERRRKGLLRLAKRLHVSHGVGLSRLEATDHVVPGIRASRIGTLQVGARHVRAPGFASRAWE